MHSHGGKMTAILGDTEANDFLIGDELLWSYGRECNKISSYCSCCTEMSDQALQCKKILLSGQFYGQYLSSF